MLKSPIIIVYLVAYVFVVQSSKNCSLCPGIVGPYIFIICRSSSCTVIFAIVNRPVLSVYVSLMSKFLLNNIAVPPELPEGPGFHMDLFCHCVLTVFMSFPCMCVSCISIMS